MKKSERLLDAIGQIDDKYVEEAALAGKQPEDIRMAGKDAGNCDGSAPSKTGVSERTGKGRKKKTVVFRWQGALAACAVLAVCISVFALLQKNGVMLSPFEGKSGAPQMAEENAAMEAAPAGRAAAPENAAGADAGPSAHDYSGTIQEPAEAAPAAGEAAAQDAEPEQEEKQGVTDAENDAEKEGAPTPAALEMELQDRQGRSATASAQAPVTVSAAAYDGGKVTFTLVNENTGETVTYGPAYYLERLTEGLWQEVAPIKEVGWEDIGYEIKAGEAREETVDAGSLYGDLAAGAYRLVKECSLAAADGIQQYPFYVEFMVEE